MQRWILNLIGAAFVAAPALFTRFGANSGFTLGRESGSTPGMSEWMSLLVTAGAYLLYWGPVLLGALIIVYANRRRG